MPTTLQHAADGLTPIARGISNLVAEGTHVKGTYEERLIIWLERDDHLSGHRHTLEDFRRVVLAAQGQRVELCRALAEQRAAAFVRHLDAKSGVRKKVIYSSD